MKELDIEIIERDNNIPPEKSILAKHKTVPSDLYYTFKERRRALWDIWPVIPRFLYREDYNP